METEDKKKNTATVVTGVLDESEQPKPQEKKDKKKSK